MSPINLQAWNWGKAKDKIGMPAELTYFQEFSRKPFQGHSYTSYWPRLAMRKAGNQRFFFWLVTLIPWRKLVLVNKVGEWIDTEYAVRHVFYTFPWSLWGSLHLGFIPKYGLACTAKEWRPQSPVFQNISESPTTLLHTPASGPVAFYFSHVPLRVRVSLKTAYGSICRAVPHCHFRPWTLLRKPSPISLCLSTHRSLFSMPSWPPGQKSFLLIAGKSIFLPLVNLVVILPTPKNPVHPLEPGESSTSFFLYSDTSLPEATFTVPTTYLNKRERERRKYKLMS